MVRFTKPPQDWMELLGLILQSPLGRKTLEEFYRCCGQRDIEVKAYPSDVRAKLVEASPTKEVLGAVFVIEGSVGTIYVDPKSEIGIVAPFFFHEMIHCLDDTLWVAAKQKLSPLQKQNVIFNSACRAFHFQHLFQEELKKVFPDLRDFHQTRYPHISFLNRALLPDEIAKLYPSPI
jgi:hypothetical protein